MTDEMLTQHRELNESVYNEPGKHHSFAQTGKLARSVRDNSAFKAFRRESTSIPVNNFNMNASDCFNDRVGFFSLRQQAKVKKGVNTAALKKRILMEKPKADSSYSTYTGNHFGRVKMQRDKTASVHNGRKIHSKMAERKCIYVIPDGVDLLNDKYRILKQDIRPYIDSMLPDKKEIEKKYSYLTEKERIKLLKPSEQIREQVFNQFLSDLGEKIGPEKEFVALFDTK